jgi:hypothetical protein
MAKMAFNKECLYQHTRLKFKEEADEVLQLEHRFLW